MPAVYLKPGENSERLIQRFKRKMMEDDILTELKERERYRKPSQIRQDKLRALRQKIKEQNRKGRKQK